jgi:hypothetical protein
MRFGWQTVLGGALDTQNERMATADSWRRIRRALEAFPEI